VMVLNKGDKVAEGKPKEMIDVYKQILVGQYDEGKVTELIDEEKNHELLEYGSGEAKIIDYYVTDAKGLKTQALIKGSEFTIHMKVHFNETVDKPIFAYKFVNPKGVEITGTNTMFEKAFLETVEKGKTLEITFTQEMNLQGGEYLISFGCTGYRMDTFVVYHRMYYAMSVAVISDKDTVGYYDMNSKITVKEVE
ncbi:MAG: Wzt carbohydrate-binding domain-containing protein, partial [Lachnospiraceae bacterium]|nr:Wzt carbohydrate-binding domain-containing protein [Lachnospiraceae bacterium]